MSALLETVGLTKRFTIRRSWLGRTTAELHAVDGIDLTIKPGEVLGLVGESGCGKSTTGRLITRLIDPSAGQIIFKGRNVTQATAGDLRALRRHIQIVFQDPYGSLNPRMTVGATLSEPLALHGIGSAAERTDRVAKLLNAVTLSPKYAARYPHELSGGQRQRVGIARALAVEPELIVCDEAVSALDVSIQAQILNLLADLRQQLSIALLFISHNLAVVRHLADRVAVMYLGRIVETGPTATLLDAPKHPYTRALLAAVPHPDPTRSHRPTLLTGDVPNAIAPPTGCHFHPRCAYADAACRASAPDLSGVVHQVACHHAERLAPIKQDAPRRPSAGHARLRRLQAAFANPEFQSSQDREG